MSVIKLKHTPKKSPNWKIIIQKRPALNEKIQHNDSETLQKELAILANKVFLY
jgi:hypothetical protein